MPDPSTFNCPSCGGTLDISLRQPNVKCPYCGSVVLPPEPIREMQERAQAVGALKGILEAFIGGTVVLGGATVALPLVIVAASFCFVLVIMLLVLGILGIVFTK